MNMELVRGGRGNLLLRIRFEEKSNFSKNDMTWVPTIKEMEDLSEALDMCLKYDKKEEE